jgi:hypothetical protein
MTGFDREAALGFLCARFGELERGERIEIRALDRSKGGTVVGRRFFASVKEACAYAASLPVGCEVYYGVNPRLGEDGTKAGVSRILVIWADLDYKHFDDDPDKAQAMLDSFELPPTWTVESGGGLHPYWLIEAVDAQTNLHTVETLLRSLYARLGNLDSVQDVSRILRLPGSFNHKYGTPRRVRVIQHTPSARYTLAKFRAHLPALPPQANTLTSGPTQPGDLDEREVRHLLSFIDPCLPYREYLAVWMAVHALFPGAAGMQLVDDWSSEARANSGQYSSPRTQPTKHAEFRRSGGAGAVGMGTLVYYAQLGGWTPPTRPTPLIKRKQTGWRAELADLGEIDRNILPYFLTRQLDYLGDTTTPLPLDWSIHTILAYGGLGIGHIRFENLTPGLWFMGVARSNAGKNIITDAILDIWKRVRVSAPFVTMTSGSPEGMWKELDGVGLRLLAYHREYAGTLKGFSRDFMGSARDALCNLYDGADVHHILAKKTIHAIDPYLITIATTTPKGIADNMTLEDLQSGYVNRFMVCFADNLDTYVEDRPNPMVAESIGVELTRHLDRLKHVRQARWDTPKGEVPALWKELCVSLGVGTGRLYRVEESVDDVQRAVYRELARVKKVSMGLEAYEHDPQLDGNTLVVRNSNLGLAILIVLRASAYLRGMESIINVSADEALMNKIKRLLRDKGPTTKAVLRSLCHADIKPFDTAFKTMLDEGSLSEMEAEPGKRSLRYKVG